MQKLNIHENCNYQATTTNERLAEHQRAVHEGSKYSCRKCEFKVTTKGSLVEHHIAKGEGIIYPCQQCNYQVTQKGHLTLHQTAVHEGMKYICKQPKRIILLKIKGEYMKESNTCKGNTPDSFLKRDIWMSTKGQYMKESNTLVVNNYFKRKIWRNFI